MAREEQTNYNSLVAQLRKDGPECAYLLYGEEDYLLNHYLDELKKLCLKDAPSEFSYLKLEGSDFTVEEISDFVSQFPFLSDRTLVEIRGFDNKSLKGDETDKFAELLSDIPEYATLALIMDSDEKPDMRRKPFTDIKKHGRVINFTTQGESSLVDWIKRHFKARKKEISSANARKLISWSGNQMSVLLPEIEKLSYGVRGERIESDDIELIATKQLSAKTYEICENISAKNFADALAILQELVQSRTEPVIILSSIGTQLKKLYAAAIYLKEKPNKSFIIKIAGSQEWLANKYIKSASGFSLNTLAESLRLCVETDFMMKNGQGEPVELLYDLIYKIYAEVKSESA
jgi:DNA polymerase-3 subunit delta